MVRLTVDKENHLPVDVHCEDQGSGRPVVLVHGWPLSAGQWEPQVPALLAAGYRVVTFDQRGFGNSSKPTGGYDFDTLAGDLHMVIEQLGLHDVTLVGFSSGASTAIRYLSRFGDARIAQAVLVSAAGPFLRQTDAHPDGVLSDAKSAGYIRCLTEDRVSFIHRFAGKFFAGSGTPTDPPMRTRIVVLAAAASTQGALESFRSSVFTDLRDDLRAITVPTLVVHGDADTILPVEGCGARVADHIADSRLVVFPGAPHGLNVTRAAEFNCELLAFLER
jgi:pimeloyl-ACP methyl ester carboxylesterase